MSGSRKRFEEPVEIGKLIAAKRRVMLIQGVVILALACSAIPLSGARLSPLYLPIGWSLLVLMGGGILLTAESFLFKRAEILRTDSESGKYVISKYAMRDSLIMGVIALVIGVVLVLPAVKSALNDVSSRDRSEDIYGSKCIYFPSRDWLGLSEVVSIYVQPASGSVEAYLLYRSDADRFCVDKQGDAVLGLALNNGSTRATASDPLVYPVAVKGFREMTLIIRSTAPRPLPVEYGLGVRILDIVLPTLGALVLVYGLLNLGFAAALHPARKRFAGGSIYR